MNSANLSRHGRHYTVKVALRGFTFNLSCQRQGRFQSIDQGRARVCRAPYVEFVQLRLSGSIVRPRYEICPDETHLNTTCMLFMIDLRNEKLCNEINDSGLIGAECCRKCGTIELASFTILFIEDFLASYTK